MSALPRIDYFMRDLRSRGIELSLLPGDQIRYRGEITEADAGVIRARRAEVIEFLQAACREAPGDWEQLRRLAPEIGRLVSVSGRRVLLWGLSPQGAVVRDGGLLYGVDVSLVELVGGKGKAHG